jgi:hypothetical protein
MRYLPPCPWRLVTAGTVVLDNHGTPRTVAARFENLGTVLVLLEGDPNSHYFAADNPAMAQPVELDAADAIGTLHAAGLNPAPIEGAT